MTSDLRNRRFTYQRPRGESGKKMAGAAQERAGNRNKDQERAANRNKEDQPRLRKAAAAAKAGGSLDAQTYVALGTKLELKKLSDSYRSMKNCIVKPLEGAEKLIGCLKKRKKKRRRGKL